MALRRVSLFFIGQEKNVYLLQKEQKEKTFKFLVEMTGLERGKEIDI